MGVSQSLYLSLPFLDGSLGPVAKAALIGVAIIVVTEAFKLLTKRSPYENIPGPTPSSSTLGYLVDMHNPDDLDFHFKMTERYGHVARLKGGLLGSDALYISDPLALHSVLVKDQYNFPESTEFSGLFGVIHHGDQLASVSGEEHKRQRKLLNPVFTAAHVSKLSPLFHRIATELRDRLKSEVKSNPGATLDILDRLTRTALELISQGGIGHTFNSFDKNSKEFHEFHEALKDVLPTASHLFFLLPFLESWRKKEPVWLRRFVANLAYVIPWTALRRFKESVDIMHPVCAKVFHAKKKLFDEGGIAALANTASGGRDLTTLLMQANAEADEEDRMPDETVIANMSSIVLGGQETTSGAMSRLLDLMTLDTSLQEWLREEINEALAKKNGEPLDFYELNALPRLDATCREALRLFAPVSFVWRQTKKDIVVPLQYPITDVKTGKEIREILIHEGTAVYVGMGALNRSTALWGPDAAEFKPQRWMGHQAHESTVEQVKTPGIFSNIMTFLGGGRGCPGMKFALLEIKTVMSVLLPTFRFERTDATVTWRLGITLSPYVKGKEEEGPQVPMKVSLIAPFSPGGSLGSLAKAALIGLIIVLVTEVIKALTKRSPYENIPGPKPSSSLGYLLDMHDPNSLDFHFKMTERYGHVARLKGGLLGSDALYISDPLALHSILVKDQYNFPESTEFSGLFGVVHHGDQLASVSGEEHKKQRKLMNPVFTAAHVSKLCPLFHRIATELRDRLKAEVKLNPGGTLDILDHFTRTALELISQGGIGHTFNSFDKNSKEFHEFHNALKDVLPCASKLFYILPFLESWRKKEPVWLRRFIANLAYVIPLPGLYRFKESIDIIHPVCANVFNEKKKLFNEGGIAALAHTPSGGRDLTTLLMQANAEADEEDRMPDETVIANMSSIVLAGQDTTSGAMCRLLDLMTLDRDLQDWLREEIDEALAKKNGKPLDFYELNALPRLDATCREALRLFSPVTFVWRQTKKDTVVPLQYPITDTKTGREINEILIHEGTSVYVGMAALNRSTTLWGPDAAQFIPERWMGHQAYESTMEKIKTPGIFSNIMTFLGGGRGCPGMKFALLEIIRPRHITYPNVSSGMKFALLEIKTVMSVLLPAFRFQRTEAIVDWRLGITLSPYVRGKETEGPQVPMRVSLM
ncbi:hypothetical protein CVT24_006364 [Panaeolus cyanescens]|uniref:Cytochrome P450 n=1 Tax=Panaeolus cyanescens TaxID=181874 RepID=A0A409YE40_9AGAR|nr:hypothetical protein CVT24_006364 [Panaeolus cyanescens]